MKLRSSLPDSTGQKPALQPMLDIEFAQLTDTGQVRDHNEDYLGHFLPTTPMMVRTHGWLFALADGVGGQQKGEVASRTAIESLLSEFRSAPGHEPHSSLLPALVKSANTRVFETGMAATPAGAAIASTIVACALRFDRAVIAHVGDSRCYLVRRAHATILTRDHTIANEHLRMGLLSGKDAADANTRHILSRSLGNEMFVNVDTREIQVFVDDILVLCSDGLHGPVETSEIATIATHSPDLEAAARKLVILANQRDGSDNVSVQLIRVRNVERVGMYRGRPYRLH
jgi:serine/threonine protein phosphatase PrpC